MSEKTTDWLRIPEMEVVAWEDKVDKIYLNAHGERHHEKHIDAGIKLLQYFVPKNAVHFPVINEAFYKLGQAVSHIMEKFHNNGVSSECSSWLGRTVEDFNRDTLEVSLAFLPSDALQKILPNHMTNGEKMLCYITYLRGMRVHHESRHEYNRKDAKGPVVVGA